MTKDKLSPRLMAVADEVSECDCVYDIGCDHAFLSIYLVSHGKASRAIASDMRKGPLDTAAEHIKDAGLLGRIDLVLSDGLSDIDIESNSECQSNALIIAGMGGPLILRILEDGASKLKLFSEIIISPQSRIEDVRASVADLDLTIIDETLIKDSGKFYTILKLTVKERISRESSPYDYDEEHFGKLRHSLGDRAERIFNRYGAYTILRRDDTLMSFLEWERGVLEGNLRSVGILEHADAYERLRRELDDNRTVYELIGG